MKKEVKKAFSGLKITVIVFCILIILFLGFIGFVINHNNQVNSEIQESLERSYLDLYVKKIYSSFYKSDVPDTDSLSLEEINSRFSKAKDFNLKQFRDLKQKGKAEIHYQDVIYNCSENGEIITRRTTPNDQDVNCTKDTTEIKNPDDMIDKGYSEGVSSNPNNVFEDFISKSFLISLSENPKYNYEKINSENFGNEELIANAFSVSDFVDLKSRESQIFSETLIYNYNKSNTFDEVYSDIDLRENTSLKLERFEDYIDQIEVPTKKEINSLTIYDECMEQYSGFSDFRVIGGVLGSIEGKKSYFSSKSKVCRKFDTFQKEYALFLLEKIEDEENPGVVLTDKLYLQLFVNCGGEITLSSTLESDPFAEVCDKKEIRKELENLVDYMNGR